MDIKGRWNVAKIMSLNDEGDRVWLNEEEFRATPAYDPDYPFDPFKTAYYFDDDNKVKMMIPVPEGVEQSEIDEAVASGAAKLVDGMLVMEDKDPIMWKEENGVFYHSLGESGEPGAPWQEMTEEDGLLQFMAMYLLAR